MKLHRLLVLLIPLLLLVGFAFGLLYSSITYFVLTIEPDPACAWYTADGRFNLNNLATGTTIVAIPNQHISFEYVIKNIQPTRVGIMSINFTNVPSYLTLSHNLTLPILLEVNQAIGFKLIVTTYPSILNLTTRTVAQMQIAATCQT